MPKLPLLKLRKVCHALDSAGFQFVRQEGSHMTYIKISEAGKFVVTVPHYPEIEPHILNSIIKQSGMTREEFLKLLD